MEPLRRERGAQGVLRSGLWGQCRNGDHGPIERTVTWTTYEKEHSFLFTGGVIVTSKLPLADLPELQAVKTRIACMHLQAGDAELVALMHSIALRGYERDGRRLEPRECRQVCEYVIDQSRALHWQMDIWLQVNSFESFAQWQKNDVGCHWHDLVASRLRQRPTTFRNVSVR